MLINDDISILVLGALVLVFSAFIMQTTNGIFDLSCLSIPGIWYFSYLIIIFLPSFFVFYSKIGQYRYAYIYTMASALVTVPFGILFANIFLKFRPVEIQNYHRQPIDEQPRNILQFSTYALLLLISIALIVMWYREQTTPVPLFHMLMHPEQADELTMLREYSFKLLDSPIRYLYHLTRDFSFPFLILIACGNYYYSRSRIWLFLFMVASVFGLFFAGASIAKSPVFSIILLLLINLFILKGGKLAWWQIVVGVVLCLFFPVLVLMLGQGYLRWEGFTDAFGKVMERIFTAPSSIVYYSFEIVPERYPFQMGRCMGALSKLLGLEPTDIGQYTAWYITGEDYGTTSVSGAFVTELFGDFGYTGLLIGGVFVGVLMQWLHVSIIRSRKTIAAVVTYVLFIYFFSTLTYLQIVGALILSGAPLLWILYKSKLLG